MSRTAAICARVSTDAQAEKGRSIQTQIEAMIRYCQREGLSIAADPDNRLDPDANKELAALADQINGHAVYIDDGVSGSIPIRSRRGGARLYRCIDHKLAEAVVFFTLDRATRDADVIEIHEIRRDVRNADMELHYADSGKADLSAMGSIIDHVRAAAAAEERRKIAERTIRGREAKARAGRVVGAGRAPYGYQFERDADGVTQGIQIVEDEAKAVRLIFDWYANGDELGNKLAFGAICRRLRSEQVPKPSKPNSFNWVQSTIADILSNETYAGVWRYGESIQVAVPAIIDRELFDKAQAQRKANHESRPIKISAKFLLTGFFRCGMCGRAVSGSYYTSSGKRYGYYGCGGKGGAEYTGSNCKMPRFRKDPTESSVWFDLTNLCVNSKLVQDELRKSRDAALSNNAETTAKLKEVDAKLARLRTEAQNISARARSAPAGSLAASVIDAEFNDINAEHERLTKIKLELEDQIRQSVISEDEIEGVGQWALEVAIVLFGADDDQKRRFMSEHGVKLVALGRDEIRMSITVGGETVSKNIRTDVMTKAERRAAAAMSPEDEQIFLRKIQERDFASSTASYR